MNRRKPIDPIAAAALKRLRMMTGALLKNMTEPVGVSQQIMSRWENAQAIIPVDRLGLYLGAIGKTHADFERMIQEVRDPTSSIQLASVTPAPPTVTPIMANIDMFNVKDEDMSPWCEPGEVVLYKKDEHPRRMEGCLVQMKSGEKIVRLYVKQADGHVFLQRINPDRVETYAYSDIEGVFRITFRGRQ